MPNDDKLPEDPPTAADREEIGCHDGVPEPEAEAKEIVIPLGILVKILSVAAWVIVIIAAEAYAHPRSIASLGIFSPATPLYGFVFSYQLAIALFIGNAFAEAEKTSRRVMLGILWCWSFAAMFTIACPVLLDAIPPFVTFSLTPLSCLLCGICLITFGHVFSGALTAGFSLITWTTPVLSSLLTTSFCL